jgi:hypothetical protein
METLRHPLNRAAKASLLGEMQNARREPGVKLEQVMGTIPSIQPVD